MTDQHPITVPLNLIEDWRLAPEFCDGKKKIVMVTVSRERMQYIADQAAQWGANQELDACCEWLASETPEPYINALRTARRPKPPSLKEQALEALRIIPINPENGIGPSGLDIIRRALESLPND